MRMPLHKIEHLGIIHLEKKRFLKIFPINSSIKLDLPLWPQPTPGEHGLNKLESVILEDASTQI